MVFYSSLSVFFMNTFPVITNSRPFHKKQSLQDSHKQFPIRVVKDRIVLALPSRADCLILLDACKVRILRLEFFVLGLVPVLRLSNPVVARFINEVGYLYIYIVPFFL